MDKLTRIFLVLWAVLAVASFVSGWFAPLFWGIINWAFGGFNLMLIGGWVIDYIQKRKQENKSNNTEE